MKSIIASIIVIESLGIRMIPNPMSMAKSVGSMAASNMPVWPLISRPAKSSKIANFMYSRETQSPMVWFDLRKQGIYNIFPASDHLDDLLNQKLAIAQTQIPPVAPVTPGNQGTQAKPSLYAPPVMRPLASFLQTDPNLLRNGDYVTKPLRTPPQAFVNAVVAENSQGIFSKRKILHEIQETQKLQKSFDEGIARIKGLAFGPPIGYGPIVGPITLAQSTASMAPIPQSGAQSISPQP